MINENNEIDEYIITTNNNFKLLDNYQYITPYLSTYNKHDRNCVICLETYNKLELDNQLLKYNHCGHLYIHEQCLNNWFSNQTKCLLCKEVIIHKDSIQEEETEAQTEPSFQEPSFQNITFRLHNIHSFTMNNTHRYVENNIINSYQNNQTTYNQPNYGNNINDELLFVQNELIFHLNNTISRRNFSIFVFCFKLLYFIPPMMIFCMIFEIDKYLN
jgi:hypothetical protein